jgi:hypothetical protein
MREGFRLVCKKEDDITRFGLGFEQLPAQARTVHGGGVLAAL